MGKDDLTLTLGIIYAVCVVLIWMLLFMPFEYCTGSSYCYIRPYMSSSAGGITSIGAAILIPTFIMVLIFIISTDSSTSWQTGFGIGVFGWCFCVGGSLISLIMNNTIHYIPILILIISFLLIGIGIILFARIWKYDEFTRDKTKFGWGLINLIFMFLAFLFFIGPSYGFYFGVAYYNIFSFYGVLFYIPAFIFNTIFFASAYGDTSGKLGFGFGLPGWIFSLVGCIISFFSPLFYLSAAICLILTVPIMLSGFMLFKRLEGPDAAYFQRTRVIRRTVTPPSISPTGPVCPSCNRATTYIAQYERYYCYTCRRYV